MIKHMNEHILHGSKLEIPSTSSFLPAKCTCNLQVFDAISIQQTRRTETSKAYFTVDRAVVSTLSLPFTSNKSERLYKTSLSDFADAVTTPQIRLDVLKESFICKQNRQKLGIPNAFKVQSSFRISEKHQVYWCIPGNCYETTQIKGWRRTQIFSHPSGSQVQKLHNVGYVG